MSTTINFSNILWLCAKWETSVGDQLANPPLISLDIGSYIFENILRTLIVMDANRDSYSGAIFRLTKGCHNSNTELLTEDIKNIFPEATSLQFIGITGSNFDEKLRMESPNIPTQCQ